MAKVEPQGSGQPPESWRRRWIAWRNRTIGRPGFQKAMAALPGIGGMARRRAASLFDLIAGFAYSQATLALEESGLLDALAGQPLDKKAAAKVSGLEPEAADRLLRAAGAIGLTEQYAPGWWMLGEQGAALVGNAGARAMLRHHRILYRDLTDPLDLFRKNRRDPTNLSEFWTYAGAKGEATDTAAYSELMAASQHLVAEQAVGAYDFSRHRRLLDLGGGQGAFLRAVGQANPELELGLFDLPDVVERAKVQFEEAGMAQRTRFHPGSFFDDEIPSGYDLVSLTRILHDHDDAPVLDLLQRVRESMAKGSTLLIIEPLADTPRAKAMGDTYFGLYLWAMGSGRPRSAREYGEMLRDAGFANHRLIRPPQPIATSLIVAAA